MDPALTQFYRQYLQQVNDPCYPSAKTLLNPYVQEQIFRYMFDESQSKNLPPARYQRRILKIVTDRIESAIEHPDEDEISDALMQHMAYLSTAAPLSPLEAAQQKSVISYFPPLETSESHFSSPILIEESPQLLAAGGNVGFRTWDSCLRLAYYLSTAGAELVKQKTILELGAGTGMLSILCAGLLGASHVLSTDGNPDIVAGIDHNINLNSAHLTNPQTSLSTAYFNWTDLSSLKETICPDREPNQLPKYDLILGADITYNPQYFEPLIDTLSALTVLFPDIPIIICGAIRNISTFGSFVSACAAQDFTVEDIEFDCPPFHQQKGFFHTIALPIRIMRVVRRTTGS